MGPGGACGGESGLATGDEGTGAEEMGGAALFGGRRNWCRTGKQGQLEVGSFFLLPPLRRLCRPFPSPPLNSGHKSAELGVLGRGARANLGPSWPQPCSRMVKTLHRPGGEFINSIWAGLLSPEDRVTVPVRGDRQGRQNTCPSGARLRKVCFPNPSGIRIPSLPTLPHRGAGVMFIHYNSERIRRTPKDASSRSMPQSTSSPGNPSSGCKRAGFCLWKEIHLQ